MIGTHTIGVVLLAAGILAASISVAHARPKCRLHRPVADSILDKRNEESSKAYAAFCAYPEIITQWEWDPDCVDEEGPGAYVEVGPANVNVSRSSSRPAQCSATRPTGR